MFKKTIIATAVLATVGVVHAQMVGKLTVEQYQESTVLARTGVIEAWNRGITGRGAVVAVIDQGFDQSHSDLNGQILAYKNFQPGTAVNTAWGLHGTQMASIIAGLDNGRGTVGVAPDAKLLLAQVGNGGSTTYINMTAVKSAMAWADTMGAHVVNLSLASTYDSTFKKEMKQVSQGIWQAPARYGSMYGNKQNDLTSFASANKNSVIVAAAGNQGLAYAAFPAAFATQTDAKGELYLGGRVLIVGSVNTRNEISSFSNKAGHICTNLVGNVCKDKYQVKDFYVVAPGEVVYTAVPNQIRVGNTVAAAAGTSVSTAYVSGGMALMKEAWPQLRANQMVDIVIKTATDLGVKGVDEVYGQGMVNFDSATRPQGNLVYTTKSLGSNTVSGQPVSASVNVSGGTAQILKASAVLKNVQIVDEYSRNYSADLTQIISKTNPNSSLYASPFLAVNPTNYRELSAQATDTTKITAFSSNLGAAMQFDTKTGNTTLSYQLGVMSEKDGFLNNYSQGLMGFGNSSTVWAIGGINEQVNESIDVIASFGLGVTQNRSNKDSVVSISPRVMSDTWKFGVNFNNILNSNNVRDSIGVSLQGPVAVRRGYATVSAITGYSYTGDDDGEITAHPEITSERLSLVSPARQMDLVLNYSAAIQTDSQLSVNVIRQFNAGGVSGVNSDAVAVKYTMTF